MRKPLEMTLSRCSLRMLAAQAKALETRLLRDFLDNTRASCITKPFGIERLEKEINHVLTKGTGR